MKARTFPLAVFVLFVATSSGVAQTPDADLKAQIDALKADYGNRIQALETQLQQLQAQTQTPPQSQPAAQQATAQQPTTQQPTAQVPPGAEGAGGPTGALPVYGGGASGSKA